MLFCMFSFFLFNFCTEILIRKHFREFLLLSCDLVLFREKKVKKYLRSHSEDEFLYDTKSYIFLSVQKQWSHEAALPSFHPLALFSSLCATWRRKKPPHSFCMMCSIAFVSIYCSVKHTYKKLLTWQESGRIT